MVGKSGTAASVCHPPSPAAAQTIGAEVVARAEPDGRTLLVTPPAPLVLEQWLDPKWASQALALEPVTVLATFPQVLVINPKVPAQTFAEWIAYAYQGMAPAMNDLMVGRSRSGHAACGAMASGTFRSFR
jgi:tripartite-type tricarboxylate transporter receptor subunit TctC